MQLKIKRDAHKALNDTEFRQKLILNLASAVHLQWSWAYSKHSIGISKQQRHKLTTPEKIEQYCDGGMFILSDRFLRQII